MDERTEITELCSALGWVPIPSKNNYMISFKQEESGRRLNVYYTTMTVTIDDASFHQQHYKNITLPVLEYLLSR